MPPTLHKLFIHGPEIIDSALLPIGQLSEEAQEARNKDFKKGREFHSRKCSREKCNQDILNFLLLSSDPIISSMRKLPKKKIQSLPKEACDLIKFDDFGANNDGDDSDGYDDGGDDGDYSDNFDDDDNDGFN